MNKASKEDITKTINHLPIPKVEIKFDSYEIYSG